MNPWCKGGSWDPGRWYVLSSLYFMTIKPCTNVGIDYTQPNEVIIRFSDIAENTSDNIDKDFYIWSRPMISLVVQNSQGDTYSTNEDWQTLSNLKSSLPGSLLVKWLAQGHQEPRSSRKPRSALHPLWLAASLYQNWSETDICSSKNMYIRRSISPKIQCLLTFPQATFPKTESLTC